MSSKDINNIKDIRDNKYIKVSQLPDILLHAQRLPLL